MKRLCSVEEIPDSGYRFTYLEGPFEEEGILLRVPGGGVVAFKNQCRHLPMRLDERDPGTLWNESGTHLACASHGALFRPSDGLCTLGPCKGSHLKRLPVEVREGTVFLQENPPGGFFDV